MIVPGGAVNRSATVRVLEVDNTTEQSILHIEQYFRGVESGVLYVDTYINGSLPHPEGNLSVTVNNNNVKYIKRSPGLLAITRELEQKERCAPLSLSLSQVITIRNRQSPTL